MTEATNPNDVRCRKAGNKKMSRDISPKQETFSRIPPALFRISLLGLAFLLLGGCLASRPRLQDHWTTTTKIAEVPGFEICASLRLQSPRNDQPLDLEIDFFDSQGRPLPSLLPMLADETGRLTIRRQIHPPRGQGMTRTDACAFVPLAAFPATEAKPGYRVRLFHGGGELLGVQTGTLALL